MKFWFTLIILLGISVVLTVECQRPAERDLLNAESDSLFNFVKKRIEEKKQYEKFRKTALPRDFENKVQNYYPVIRKYSKRYGFDWRLIVMLILKESRFKENARSHVGAMGLMQIMPSTASDIRREMDIEYIANNPRDNIAAGIYHLYKQLQKFPDADRNNRVKLALAAYNAGVGRVYDAQSVARYYSLDPQSWEGVRECLPKLTRKYWRMHLEVWELGVPNYGYFYGFDQTVSYVDDITKNYQIFTKVFGEF
jgi:membrane-bound lytic murein transglycosylase F